LLNASHISLVFETHNSNETNISTLFYLITQKWQLKQYFPCLDRNKGVYYFIKVSFHCLFSFYSHQS